MRLVAFQTKER